MLRKTRRRKHEVENAAFSKAKQYAEHAKKVACSAQIESAEKAVYAAQKSAEALEALEALKPVKNISMRVRQTRRNR